MNPYYFLCALFFIGTGVIEMTDPQPGSWVMNIVMGILIAWSYSQGQRYGRELTE